jgi:DDE superfamily endonuclease
MPRSPYGLGPKDIWNMDETGFMVGMLQDCHVLVPREIKKYYTRNPMNREMVTCVECVSAYGESIPSSIVIKGKHLLKRWLDDAPAQGHHPKTTWNVTESGYMNSDLSLLWLEHFDRCSKPHQEGAYRLLLDGHASHTTPTLIQSCYDRDIIPFCLPPHSTHLLQPLDVCVFGPYKHFHAIVTERGVRRSIYDWGKDDFLATQPEIKKTAFKKSTIVSSFRQTGIYPFDPKQVLMRLKDWNPDDAEMTAEQQVHSWFKDFIPIDPYKKDRGWINGHKIPPKTKAEIASDLAWNLREKARRDARAEATLRGPTEVVAGMPLPRTPPRPQ